MMPALSVHIVKPFQSFPAPLYKAFEGEEYARDFLEGGTLIIRCLSYYRKIEDSTRRDKDEGEGRVKVVQPRPVVDIDLESGQVLSARQETGEAFFGTVSPNPCYVCCFSGPQVDVNHLARKYGPYVVRIDQPNILVSEIGSYLERYPNLPDTMWLYCIQVRYDKDQLLDEVPEPASHERIMMSCGQKDARDRGDWEHRLVLRLPVPSKAPREVRIELKRRLEYVDAVRWPAHNADAPE